MKVLFVCLGNICRSPLAEGIFNQMLKEQNLDNTIEVDSAGTASYHTGELPDHRSIKIAAKRGIELTHRARAIDKKDFAEFDYILVMDKENFKDVKNIEKNAPEKKAKVHLIREFDPDVTSTSIPDLEDPYYGVEKSFETCFEILERSNAVFLEFLKKQYQL